jgi:hypothetical protein
MDVPVTVEIHDHEPDDDFSEWAYVVEASLGACPSNRIFLDEEQGS